MPFLPRTAALRHLTALCLSTLSIATVQAAGGHHGVDDAAVLDTGACKIETWASRGSEGRTLHGGTGCRLGPVEVGLSADRLRDDGAWSGAYALQVKWAAEVGKGVSVGLSVSPGWARHARPSYQGVQAMGLLTWQAGESVRAHANLGRFMAHQGPDETRGGLSADWTFQPGWQLMAERFKAEGAQFARAGLRWTAAPGWSVDASRAVRVRGVGQASWTLGVTREFD